MEILDSRREKQGGNRTIAGVGKLTFCKYIAIIELNFSSLIHPRQYDLVHSVAGHFKVTHEARLAQRALAEAPAYVLDGVI